MYLVIQCSLYRHLRPSGPPRTQNPICLSEERLIKPEVFPGNPSAHQCLDMGPLRIGCLLVWRVMMYRSNVVVIHTSSHILSDKFDRWHSQHYVSQPAEHEAPCVWCNSDLLYSWRRGVRGEHTKTDISYQWPLMKNDIKKWGYTYYVHVV